MKGHLMSQWALRRERKKSKAGTGGFGAGWHLYVDIFAAVHGNSLGSE
jgi:hypothetical protein